jgi:hypothetical protein
MRATFQGIWITPTSGRSVQVEQSINFQTPLCKKNSFRTYVDIPLFYDVFNWVYAVTVQTRCDEFQRWIIMDKEETIAHCEVLHRSLPSRSVQWQRFGLIFSRVLVRISIDIQLFWQGFYCFHHLSRWNCKKLLWNRLQPFLIFYRIPLCKSLIVFTVNKKLFQQMGLLSKAIWFGTCVLSSGPRIITISAQINM